MLSNTSFLIPSILCVIDPASGSDPEIYAGCCLTKTMKSRLEDILTNTSQNVQCTWRAEDVNLTSCPLMTTHT